jgi:hypothetical protein
MVSVEHPDPPEEAKFNTESKGDVTPEVDELSSGDEAHANFSGVFQRGIMPGSPEYETFRVPEVVVQRLLKKLCQIEVLKQRAQQGCELDAAQREKLGREDELLSALDAALAVAAAAFAVPQTGPESPQKRKVQSTLDAQPHSARSSRMLAALAVPQTIRTESPQQPCATEAQLGPTSQHEEPCSDLVQRREELSALEQRPQQPRVVTTQTGPSGPQEHKERSALVQRPQQSCATEAQIGPNSQHKEQSALVQRPQQPRVVLTRTGQYGQPRVYTATQSGPGSPIDNEEQSALVQRPQEPCVAEMQLGPAKTNHSKPGGFEPRAFDPGGSETPRSPQAKGPRQVPGSKRGG